MHYFIVNLQKNFLLEDLFNIKRSGLICSNNTLALSGRSSNNASARSIRSTARRPQPAVTHIVAAATQIIKTFLLLFIPYKNTQNCLDSQGSERHCPSEGGEDGKKADLAPTAVVVVDGEGVVSVGDVIHGQA